MPFVKKDSSRNVSHSTSLSENFVGRISELSFFIENVLEPDHPPYNIISISGNGGIGKSTLIKRFMAEMQSTGFKDYCLFALVNERQATPINIMEKFADQLHLAGKFEKALARYSEALYMPQAEQQLRRNFLLKKLPDLTGSVVEATPFIGGVLDEEARTAAQFFINEHRIRQYLKDFKRLEDPIGDLTRAFIEELNSLAEVQVIYGPERIKHQRRIILFFDTFEQLSAEAAPWLLNYFLEMSIDDSIVLIIAGRHPLEHSISTDPKSWLPYYDDKVLCTITLNSFTKDETKKYLATRGITTQTRIETIWELSQGLPLYLSLLTSNKDAKFDPTKDVVSNFLRWIPHKDSIKRQLALDVALLNKPFNQDDLEAFPYVDKQQSSALYHWLISQPFIQASYQDGQCTYYDLAQILFSRHLLQHSKKEYFSTRKAIINYYKEMMDNIQQEELEIKLNSALEGRVIRYSMKWLEVAMEIAYQAFLLPNTTSQRDAIEQVLDGYEYTEETGEIIKVLRKLSQEQYNTQITSFAQESIKLLLEYIEADWPNIKSSWSKHKQESLTELLRATDALLQHLIRLPSITKQALAYVYRKRGFVYRSHKEYRLAIADYDRALEMYPQYARAYASRGSAYRLLGVYDQAIQDYDHAIELEPNYAWAYIGRGETYRLCKDYSKPIVDLSRAIELEPDYAWAYNQRGITYRDIGRLSDALIDFNRSIDLSPNDSRVYYERGWMYMLIKNYRRAFIDYSYAFELNPTFIDAGWMAQWSRMCQERPSSKNAELLRILASIDSEHYVAYICQSLTLWLYKTKLAQEVLSQVDQAILLQPEKWDAYFWRGMLCAWFGLDEEALTALNKAVETGLPSVLLAPLYWLEQENPPFYERYVVSLLARII